MTAISEDKRKCYKLSMSINEKTAYIGGKSGNEYYELNESIDPTPYL